jgi:hypothetical protein
LTNVSFFGSLGDYIAILDKGSIQAQGTPLNLKTEYGSGYSLSVVTDTGNVDRVKTLAREMMPKIELVNEAAGSLAFGLHNSELSAVPEFTRTLQNEEILREWNISQSTIEEVFLRLASQSTELQNRRQEMSEIAAANNMPHSGGTTSEDQINSPELDEGGETLVDKESVFVDTRAHWRLQLAALLRKAYILKRRHWIASLIQLAIPIALVALAKKFFFEDLQINPQYDVLVWPQATISRYDTFENEVPCEFDWKLWSASPSTDTSQREILVDPTKAAASFQPPMSEDVLSFRVDGLSGQEEEELTSAIVQAFEYYLSRAASAEDQDVADAYCETSFCGPCLVEPSSFSFQELTSTHTVIAIEGFSDFGQVSQCRGIPRVCSLREYQIMLMDPITSGRASAVLNTSLAVVFDQAQSYAEDQAISSSRLFQTPHLEVSSEQATDTEYYGVQCHDCPGVRPHVWVSGPNADLFVQALDDMGFEFSKEITSEDIISRIVSNRNSIIENATAFSSFPGFDASSCADLGQDIFSNSYGNILSNENGYIVDRESISTWYASNESSGFDGPEDYISLNPGSQPSFEEQCDAAIDPLTRYRDLFPDGGITLAAFEITDGSMVLDTVWEIDDGNNMYQSYFENEPFVPSRQAVYAVYCPSDNVEDDGSCDPEAKLICARVVPSAGCDGLSSSPLDADIIDATYRVLWEVSGAPRGMPVVTSLGGQYVDYHVAVSYEDISLFVFMLTVVVALQAPNTASILVFEKNQRFVFTMLLNGLNVTMYWIGQYLAHLITCGILILTAVLLAVAVRLKAFTTQNPSIGLLFLVIFSGIHAQFGFVVLFSGMFKKERFAAVLIGFLALTILGAAILTDIASSNSLKRGWPPALSLIPLFGFYRSLVLVFWNRYTSELWAHVGVTLGSSTLYALLGIYLQTSTGVGALFRIDCGLWSYIFGSHGSPDSSLRDEDDVDDVAEADIAREEHRATKLSAEDTAIKILHLGKTFPARPDPKHAVVDVTMAMDYGEIFGLLGPNGKLFLLLL